MLYIIIMNRPILHVSIATSISIQMFKNKEDAEKAHIFNSILLKFPLIDIFEIYLLLS